MILTSATYDIDFNYNGKERYNVSLSALCENHQELNKITSLMGYDISIVDSSLNQKEATEKIKEKKPEKEKPVKLEEKNVNPKEKPKILDFFEL